MPKRVTSLRGPSPRQYALGNTSSFSEMSQQWQAVGYTVSDLSGPRFEPQSSDKRITARPTGG